MTSIDYDGARKTAALQKYKTVIDDNGNEVKINLFPFHIT